MFGVAVLLALLATYPLASANLLPTTRTYYHFLPHARTYYLRPTYHFSLHVDGDAACCCLLLLVVGCVRTINHHPRRPDTIPTHIPSYHPRGPKLPTEPTKEPTRPPKRNSERPEASEGKEPTRPPQRNSKRPEASEGASFRTIQKASYTEHRKARSFG